MNYIKEIFEKLKSKSFPNDSSETEILGDVFCDLVLFDSYIAGSIDRIEKVHNVFVPLKYDQELEDRLIDFINSSPENSNDFNVAKEYLHYLQELKKIITEVNKHLGN